MDTTLEGPARPALRGKVLVVAGNASLAEHPIKGLARSGCHIVATFHEEEPPWLGVAQWVHVDLSNTDGLSRLALHCEGVDECYLFNGALSHRQWGEQDPNEIAEIVALNLTASIVIAQMVLRHSPKVHRLGFISSRAAIRPSFDVAYAAAKSGLTGLVTSLAPRMAAGSAVFGLAPTTVLGSRMFNSFPSEVRNRHVERGAIDLEDFSDAFFAARNAPSSQINGVTLPIGVDPRDALE